MSEELTGQLTPEERKTLEDAFRNKNNCVHCGGIHVRQCPRIRDMYFHPDGSLARVRFWRDDQWPKDNIVWPEDLDTTPPTPTPTDSNER